MISQLNITSKLVIVNLLCFCSVFSFAQPPTGQVIEKIVSKVDNEIIMKSELDIAYLQFDGNGLFSPENMRCKVLETLIINKVLLAKAVIDSVVVEPAQIQDQLDRRMKMVMQQFGGDEKKLVQNYGKTAEQIKEELREQVEEQMIVQRMQGKISEGVVVTPAEVKTFFKAIPKDSLPFFSTEVEVGHIVKLPIISTVAKQEIIEQLSNFKSKIEAGESFGALATQYSEDPGSARSGGELGFFKRGELVPPYEAAALRLKPGEISDIIESQFGFHLIQLIEKRGNEYNTRHILLKPKTSTNDLEGASLFLDSLRTKIVNDSANFSRLAYKHTDDPDTKPSGGFFLDDQGDSRVPAENIDPTLYFLIDKMKVGEVSEPLPYTLPDGKKAMRIVYLKARIKPHEANLKDDYQKIYSAALAEKQNKKVTDWFNATKTEVFISIDEDYQNCDILATP